MKNLNSLPMGELIPAKPAVRSKCTQAQTIGHWSRKRKEEQRRKNTKNLGKEKMVTDKQTNGDNFLMKARPLL